MSWKWGIRFLKSFCVHDRSDGPIQLAGSELIVKLLPDLSP
jgi:hypothetical protein